MPVFILLGTILVILIFLLVNKEKLNSKAVKEKTNSPSITKPTTSRSSYEPSPTTVVTNNASIPGWEIYSNSLYAISFPNNYTYTNGDVENGIKISSHLNANHQGYSAQYGELLISIVVRPYDKTVEDYLTEYRKTFIGVPNFTESIHKTTVNGINASIYSNNVNSAQDYLFIHNNELFEIIHFPLSTSLMREGEFSKILSTFKLNN